MVGSDRIRITWITKEDVPSMVEYGKSLGEYTSSAFGEIPSSYSYMFYSFGYIHNIVIGPLEANTLYYYRCGQHDPEYKFKTPPSQFPIMFSVVGMCYSLNYKSMYQLLSTLFIFIVNMVV